MFPTIERSAAALVAVCLIGAAPGIGLAQNGQNLVVRGQRLPDGAEQRIVRIGDLDLRSEAGEREMVRRVGQAVDSICAMSGAPSPQESGLDEECRDDAWASARPQMDAVVRRARARS